MVFDLPTVAKGNIIKYENKILEIPNEWFTKTKKGFTLSKGHSDYKEYLKEEPSRIN